MTYIYKTDSLISIINNITMTEESVDNFINETTWKSILENRNKNNGVISKSIEENKNKSTIIEILNKLNNNNYDACCNELYKIHFDEYSNFNELVMLIFDKIKNTIKSNKKILSNLCYDLRNMYYIVEGSKTYFEDLLLNYAKKDYEYIMENYNKENSDRILSCLTNLYISSFLNVDIIQMIFEDLKKIITFDETLTNFSNVENKIDMLCFLLNELLEDDKIIFIINDMFSFLESEIKKYGKNITMKTKIKVLNIIDSKKSK